MSLQHILFIQIREKGIDHWIDERQISAGMLRTLYHINEIFLGTSGSVILIDEFENSLGVNCIDDLTSELLINKRDLQFVITSHHPYIT
jgi:predicted ATPase